MLLVINTEPQGSMIKIFHCHHTLRSSLVSGIYFLASYSILGGVHHFAMARSEIHLKFGDDH